MWNTIRDELNNFLISPQITPLQKDYEALSDQLFKEEFDLLTRDATGHLVNKKPGSLDLSTNLARALFSDSLEQESSFPVPKRFN